MAVSEARRKQNREAQQRRRKLLAQDEEETGPEQPAPEAATAAQPTVIAAAPMAVQPREFVRAGQIAGLVDMAFRYGLPVPDEQSIQTWLDGHPLGGSIVLELVAVAGFKGSFTLWRGAR